MRNGCNNSNSERHQYAVPPSGAKAPIAFAVLAARRKSRPEEKAWFSYRLPKPSAGFTLLELLVSITVVSLLTTTILFGWRIAVTAWAKADQLLEENRRIGATHRLLQEQMAAMIPYPVWARQGRADVFFQGEARRARFLSRYSLANRARSGLYRIEYQIVEHTDGSRQLLLNEFPVHNPEELGRLLTDVETSPEGPIFRFAPLERTSTTRVLWAGLEECRLAYYRPGGPSEPGTWVEEWSSRGSELPRGMAIRAVARAEPSQLRPVSVVAAIPHYSRAPQPAFPFLR